MLIQLNKLNPSRIQLIYYAMASPATSLAV